MDLPSQFHPGSTYIHDFLVKGDEILSTYNQQLVAVAALIVGLVFTVYGEQFLKIIWRVSGFVVGYYWAVLNLIPPSSHKLVYFLVGILCGLVGIVVAYILAPFAVFALAFVAVAPIVFSILSAIWSFEPDDQWLQLRLAVSFAFATFFGITALFGHHFFLRFLSVAIGSLIRNHFIFLVDKHQYES